MLYPFCLFSQLFESLCLSTPSDLWARTFLSGTHRKTFLIRKRATFKCQIHFSAQKAIHQARIYLEVAWFSFPYIRFNESTQTLYCIEFYSINYAMFFNLSSIQLMYIVKILVQMALLPDTRSPYLQVLIYTMGKTISIYHFQLVLSKSFNIYIFFGRHFQYTSMTQDKIMPQHNDTANCTFTS